MVQTVSKKDIADMMLSESTKLLGSVLKEESKKSIFTPLSDSSILLLNLIFENNLTAQIDFLKKELFQRTDIIGYRMLSRLPSKEALQLALAVKPLSINDVLYDKDITVSDIKAILLNSDVFFDKIFYTSLTQVIVENENDLEILKEWIAYTFSKNLVKRGSLVKRGGGGMPIYSYDSLRTFSINTDLWDRPYFKEIIMFTLDLLQEKMLADNWVEKEIIFVNRHFQDNYYLRSKVEVSSVNFTFVRYRQAYNYPNNHKLSSVTDELSVLKRNEIYWDVVNKPIPLFTKKDSVYEYVDSEFKQNMNKVVTPYFSSYNLKGNYKLIKLNDFKDSFIEDVPSLDVLRGMFNRSYKIEDLKRINLFYKNDLLKSRLKEGDSFVCSDFKDKDILNTCYELLSSGHKIKTDLFAELANVFDLESTISSKYTNKGNNFIIFSYPELYSKEDFFMILKRYIQIKDTRCLDINKILTYFSGDLLEEVVREFNLKHINFGSYGTYGTLTSEYEFTQYNSIYGTIVYHEGMRFSKELAKEIGMFFLSQDF